MDPHARSSRALRDVTGRFAPPPTEQVLMCCHILVCGSGFVVHVSAVSDGRWVEGEWAMAFT